jgi:hypothetical protein
MDYILELERIKYHIRKNEKDEGKYQKLKHMFLDLQNEIDELYPCTDDEGDEIHFIDAEYSGRTEESPTCTSTDPNNHQGDTCPIHEQHDALVAALVCAEADLEGLVSESEQDDHPAWQTLKEIRTALGAAQGRKTHSEASVINAWKYSYGRSKFGEGF